MLPMSVSKHEYYEAPYTQTVGKINDSFTPNVYGVSVVRQSTHG
jgi:hypothetical protein